MGDHNPASTQAAGPEDFIVARITQALATTKEKVKKSLDLP